MKSIKLIFTVGFLAVIFAGCNYLDYSEASYLQKDKVFSTVMSRSSSFLSNIYSYLPTDFSSIDGAMRSSATDDAKHVWEFSNVQKFNDGSWSSIQTLDDVWGEMYAGIRAANLFIANAEGQTFEDTKWNNSYKEDMIIYNNYPYEARFLRAFFYFELIKRYENVPLITTVLTDSEANNVTQSSFNEVVNFILKECDALIPKLPASYATFGAPKETGRVTSGAARALKARLLLYAASPLHNPAGTAQKWDDAAKASKDIINTAAYSLEATYNAFLNNVASKEVILEAREGNNNYFEANNFPIGIEGGNTGTCPTQNLVDSYEMVANGLSIAASNSGYNPANPYAGRDPRLALTVILNNSTFKSLTMQCWYGGANGAPLLKATKTGYYLRKYVIEAISLSPNNISTKQHTWALFRYGEVLLNYAEAMNEVYGPENAGTYGMTALQAVNLVRTRAKMPAFPLGLSKDNFRTKLQNERRVELAFEDHRFWDIRRWKIGANTTSIYGMDITKNADGTFKYTKMQIEQRIFDTKMNLYPIPLSEIYKNNKLKQNIGW